MRKVYRAKRFDIPGKADFRNSSEVAGGSQEIMSQTQAEELDLQAQGLTSISEKAFAGSPNLKIL